MFSTTQKVAATPIVEEIKKTTVTQVERPVTQTVKVDVGEAEVKNVTEVQQPSAFIIDKEQGRALQEAVKTQQANASMVSQALNVQQTNLGNLQSVNQGLADNSAALNAAWSAQQEYERKLMEATKNREDITMRLEAAKKSELEKNRLLQAALSSQQGNTAQLGASLSAEQQKTGKIEELLAAQQEKTNTLQSAFLAEQQNTQKLQQALKEQQDIITQLERIRLTQPGDITMVEHAAMPKPTSYIREEVQKNVVTVDNRVGAPEVVSTRVETGMKASPAVIQTTTTTQATKDDQAMAKAMGSEGYSSTRSEQSSWGSSSQQQPPVMGSTSVGNSMMGQSNVTSSAGSSGLGYHPLSAEGIEKATYASYPGQTSDSALGSSSTSTSGMTTGEKIKAKLEHAKDVVQSKIEGTSSTTSTAGASGYSNVGASGYTDTGAVDYANTGASGTGYSTTGSAVAADHPSLGERIKAKFEHAKDVVQSKIEGTHSTTTTTTTNTKTGY
jgi:putative component of toxin-antitoxin plasmid stabilization module